jgi:hypothetical protein
MSGANMVPMMAAFVPSAAIAAARRRMRREEKMAKYGTDDLDGWEFKIVRAYTRKFKSQDMIEKVRMEEARAGWELIEKFDDYRLRFKRRIEKRAMDKHLEIDPYRSQLAAPKRLVVAIIAGILIMLIGILILIGNKTGFDHGVVEGLTIPGMIFLLLAIFGFVATIVVLRKRM